MRDARRHGLAIRSTEGDAASEPCNICGCPNGKHCNEDEDGNGYHVRVWSLVADSFWVCPGDCAVLQYEAHLHEVDERNQIADAAMRLGGRIGNGTFK